MTAGLPLMKSLLTPIAKSVFLSLGLTAGMSAADAAIQKKKKKKLWIRNYSINNFECRNGRYNEKVKSLEESGLIVKGITKTIKNETK